MSQEAFSEQMSTSTQSSDEQTVQQSVQQEVNTSSQVDTNTNAPAVVDVVSELDRKAHQESEEDVSAPVTEQAVQVQTVHTQSDQVAQTDAQTSTVVPQEQSHETSQSQETNVSTDATQVVTLDVKPADNASGESEANVENRTEQKQAQSEQSFNDKTVSFEKIGLDVVSFNRTFCRNRGTLSQMVKSFEDMSDRLSEPLNDYQKGLYPQIQSECKKIVESYSQLLSTVDPADNYVFGFYINGPSNDGKRKATTTAHEQKSYGVSEYKETLKSTNDRLRHIKIDCQRKLKESTRNNQDVFQRMIDFCDAYHQTVDSHLVAWDTFIAQFRQDNNINKPERPAKQPRGDMVRRAQRPERPEHSDRLDRKTRVSQPRPVRVLNSENAANASTGVEAGQVKAQTQVRRPERIRSDRVRTDRGKRTDRTTRATSDQVNTSAPVDGLETLRTIANAIKSAVDEAEKQQPAHSSPAHPAPDHSGSTDIVLSTINARARPKTSRGRGPRPNSTRDGGNVDQTQDLSHSTQTQSTNQNVRYQRPRAPRGNQNTAQTQLHPEVKSDGQVRVSKRVLLRTIDSTSNTQSTDPQSTGPVVNRSDARSQRAPRPRKIFKNDQSGAPQSTDTQPRVDATAFNSVRIVRPKKHVSAKRIVNERAGTSAVAPVPEETNTSTSQ